MSALNCNDENKIGRSEINPRRELIDEKIVTEIVYDAPMRKIHLFAIKNRRSNCLHRLRLESTIVLRLSRRLHKNTINLEKLDP